MASVVSAAVVSGELIIGLDDGSIIRAGYVTGPQGLKGDQGPLGATGPAGVDGNTLHTVEGIPDGSLGKDGDYCIDRIEWRISGPKAGGRWPQFVDMLAKGKGKKLGEKGSAGFGVTGGGGGGGSGPGGDVFTNQVLASGTGRLIELPVVGSSRVNVQYPGSPNGIIPPSARLGYQSSINGFFVDALDQLDMAMPVPTTDDPPTADVYEGKLWFDTEEDELTLYIRYGGNWVPAAPPVSLDGIETSIANIDEELLTINANVAINKSEVDERLFDVQVAQDAQDTKIEALETSQNAQDTKIEALETSQNAQDGRLDALEAQDQDGGDYVKKSGDTMSGNLHVLRDSVNNANIDTVPLVVVKPLNESGSVARFRLGQIDVAKINNQGQLELEGNKIIEVGAPTENTDAATKKYADDIGRAANDYTSSSISQIQLPDTSDLLKLNGTRAMTGVLSMGNNKIGALATPVSRTDAANRGFVEDTVDAGVANPQMVLQLWQYKGLATSDTQYQALRAGEFMIKKTDGGDYNWQVAINVKDRSGKYWYPYNKGTGYVHNSHIDYLTINDCFGQTRFGGKQESLHFNEWSGVGAYLRVDGRFWKQTFSGNPFTQDNWYIIKLSGLLPHWRYPLDVQQNGQSAFNTDFYGVDDASEELAEPNGSGEQS